MTRILTIDIETSPSVADVWGLFKQNVALSQLRASTRVISFAAKWHDAKRVAFHSDFHDGHDEMVKAAHELLDEADIAVHWNGERFDIPHLRREFLIAGLPPTSPFRQVDLMKVVKREFRFLSNKLDHVTRELGLPGKVKHDGHELWVKCMAGDAAAWAKMRRYNIQDVRITDQAYDKLLPYIPSHPHMGLLNGSDEDCCSRCGSDDLERRGFAYTPLSQFQQYRCRGCGAWSRGKKALATVDVRGIG